jgi:ubiquinone/menaquinone biosynthesis C-methylase UbiE
MTSGGSHDSIARAHGPHRQFSGVFGLVAGLSMTVGGGPRARLVAGLAGLAPTDRVVDVGCGPGTAMREAAKSGATGTGGDPSPQMLSLGRRLSGGRSQVSFVEGTAESLPLPDRSATVAWAIASSHHWADVPAALAEIDRVLAPGGRLLILERLTREGARGHGAHGLTDSAADEMVKRLAGANFIDARREAHAASGHTFVVVRATKPAG